MSSEPVPWSVQVFVHVLLCETLGSRHQALGVGQLPDALALELAEYAQGRGQQLIGGRSHGEQLPEAPLMLTLPSLTVWDGSALHLVYHAASAQGSHHRTPGWGSFCGTSALVRLLVDGQLIEPTAPAAVPMWGHSRASLDRGVGSNDPLRWTNSRELSVAAFVVDSLGTTEPHTLLHWHEKGQMWLPPGGHLEAGESPTAAAVRETLEETGLWVDPGPETTRPGSGLAILPTACGLQLEALGPGHQHLDFVYLCTPTDTGTVPTPMAPFAWYTLGMAEELPLTREMRLWCRRLLCPRSRADVSVERSM